MKPLQLAWLNLTRRRTPTAIALIAISLSVSCSGMLVRLYFLSGSRFARMAHGGDAIVGAKAGGLEILLNSLNFEGDYPGFIPMNLFLSLRKEAPVRFEDGTISKPSFIRSIIPIVYFAKLGNHRVIGTDETFLQRPRESDSPRLAQGIWCTDAGSLVLGSETARSEGLHIGDHVSVTPWYSSHMDTNLGEKSETVDLLVSGVLEPTRTTWDQGAYASLSQAKQVLNIAGIEGGIESIWGPNVLNYFLIYLQPGGLEPLSTLINARTVAQVISVPHEQERLANLTGSGRILGLIVTALTLALGGLSVAAMMITRFDAMAVQLAVLRAIGFEKSEIAEWLLWEGFLLGAAACMIGGILDAVFFPSLRATLGSALPSPFVMPCPIYLSAPVWAAAIGATITAVGVPLLRLYRQDIHYSLKGSG